MQNLATEAEFAPLQRAMKARVTQVRRPNPSAPRPYDDVPVAASDGEDISPGQLRLRVYDGTWPWVPDFRRLKWMTDETATQIDATRAPTDGGGLAYVGYFRAKMTGTYRFFVQSDGGTEVFIHEARVIDDDCARTGAEVSGSILLAAGWHPLRIDYRHLGMTPARLNVTIQEPGGDREAIPAMELGSVAPRQRP